MEIAGSALHQIGAGYSWLTNGSTPGSSVGTTPVGAAGSTYSLYADSRIPVGAFHAHSNRRIKDIQGISDAEKDLATLMAVEITDYTLRDTIAQGKTPYKKVVAQQIAEVYPQAVSTHLTEVIPDIYQRAKVLDGWIMLSTDLQPGERIKLITEQGSKVYEVLEAEPTRFKVSEQITTNAQLSTVFVYGREVYYFHTVDYEAISMLNVSATQEQQRRIEEQQLTIKKLQKELQSQQAQIGRLAQELSQIKSLLTHTHYSLLVQEK